MEVRLFKPSVGEDEIEAIRDVFKRSWLGLGSKVGEFERAWSEYIGCKTSIAVNSCTAALHLALAAFNFPKGKKVLVPAITFVASATAALYNDLEPIFVDIDEKTLGMNLTDLKRKITKDCVAIMAVHMGGHPLPMDELMEIARLHDLKVIEDCAHCAGGEYNGKKLGTWGDIGCFSFEEKKGMTTGDGGMISSNDEELVEPIRPMRWVGIDKDTWKRTPSYTDETADSRHWYYEIHMVGYKYNMNDLCASIGLAQLRKLDSMNAARRKAISMYLEELREARHVRPLLPYDLSANSAYWIFGLRCDKRDDLIIHCKKNGIATGLHYMPLPMHPLFEEHEENIDVARSAYEEIITLPLFADITNKEIDYVVKKVLEFDFSY
ncbi:MAG: DegT/DnrJ/EryC1/StrS family aminotransferase [Candidatus Hodarchaeota archaeon]